MRRPTEKRARWETDGDKENVPPAKKLRSERAGDGITLEPQSEQDYQASIDELNAELD